MEDGLVRNPEMTMGNIRALIEEETYYPDYAPLIHSAKEQINNYNFFPFFFF